MLLPASTREPKEPRNNVSLNGVSNVTRITDGRHDALALLESGFDARPAQFLVSVKGLFHAAWLALLDPAGEAAGEEDGVFEDDAG